MFPLWHPQDEMERHRGLSSQFKTDLWARNSSARRRLLGRPIRHWLTDEWLGYSSAPHLTTRDVTEDLVEAFLLTHFKKNQVVYPSDVSSALGLDYDVVLRVFGKFVDQGKLTE